MFRRMTICARLILVLAGSVVIAVVTTTVSNLWLSDQLVRHAADRQLGTFREFLDARLHSEAQRALSLAQSLALNAEIQEAFAAQDRERLARMLVPGFAELKRNHGLVQMHFHTPASASFLRVQSPDKFGDDLSSFRATVVAVNRTREPVAGLENGVDGLGIRGVVPVSHGGRHVGSVEVGVSFGKPFFEAFKKATGAETAFFVRKGQEFKIFASTFAEQPPVSSAVLAAALDGAQIVETVDVGDLRHAMMLVPVRDYNGQAFGTYVLAMDRSSFDAAIDEAHSWSLIIGLAALVVTLAVGWLVSRGISNPIRAITASMGDLASGNTAARIPGQGRTDEVGAMAKALEVFRQNLVETERLRNEQETMRRQADEKSRRAMLEVLSSLVGTAVETNEGIILLGRMKREIARTNAQTQSIAAALEEMGSSIREITSHGEVASTDVTAAESAAVAGVGTSSQAVRVMEDTVQSVAKAAAEVDRLAEASAAIGTIVSQIEDIADQTNLLALNATIEAARAGEAGKGFAVVASEVKNLANQTAKATEDIRARIGSLRSEMEGIVTSMRNGAAAVENGRSVVNGLGEHLQGVASEIKGASVRIGEISAILTQQDAATQNIARDASDIAEASERNENGISAALDALDAVNEAIGNQVGSFTQYGDRAIVEIAKCDHIAFKKRVFDGVLGRARVLAEDLPDEHSCRFGQWYDTVQDRELRAHPAFLAIVKPHRLVHELGKEALQLAADGEFGPALAAAERLHDASREVLGRIDELGLVLDRREAGGREAMKLAAE